MWENVATRNFAMLDGPATISDIHTIGSDIGEHFGGPLVRFKLFIVTGDDVCQNGQQLIV